MIRWVVGEEHRQGQGTPTRAGVQILQIAGLFSLQ